MNTNIVKVTNNILTTMGLMNKSKYSLFKEENDMVLELEPIIDCHIGINLESINNEAKAFIKLLTDSISFDDDNSLFELYIDNKIKNFFVDYNIGLIYIINKENTIHCAYEYGIEGKDYITFVDESNDSILYFEIASHLSKDIIIQSARQIINLI